MSVKKMIDKVHIEKIYEYLRELKYMIKDDNVKEKVNNSIKYIEENLLSNDKEFTHVLKRLIYKRMKFTMYKNQQENKELYNIYQMLKTNEIEFTECVKRLEEIDKKYNDNNN
jgi:hypothetical protein